MISLLEIAQSINEADDDKYVSIGFGRFKLKGKEDDDDADVFVKTDSGKYVKSADQKSDDDGGKKPEEPQGGKLGGSDFDRDANRAADDEADDEVKQAIDSAEKVADKYGIESDIAGNEQGLNRVNIGSGGEYEGDNQLTVSYDDEQYHIGIQGEDAMMGPIGYMSFDSKEEMESALDKILGNEKIKDALKKGDSLEGMKDEIESLGKGGSDDNAESDDIEISDANSGPIDRDDIMDMLKNDSEVVDKMGDDVYWDGVDLVSSKFDDDTIASVDGNMTLGDLKKQIMDYEEMSETININLKEKYDRIFRRLK